MPQYVVRMQVVVETPSYLADAGRLFSPEERMAIVDRLAADPRCGLVIPGSGGIRKVRFGFGFGFGARGKSGGARVIYVFSGESLPVFALAAFAQNEKDNRSAAERKELAKVVTEIVERYRREKRQKHPSTKSKTRS